MMNILNFYESGRARSGVALIPFFDSTKITLAISTRFGNSVIDKGDGNFYNYPNPHFLDYSTGASDGANRITLNYSTAYTGNISINFKQGLKDVYSISTWLFRDSATDTKLNILNIESFFSQFPNLYSVRLLEHCYLSSEKSVFKGDLSRFPDSVERIYISCIEVQNAATDLILNFSNYNNSSKLKYFNFSGDRASLPNSNMKVVGDISKIPPLCDYFYLLKAATGSSITYTAGKVWTSAFDTLSIPLPLTTFELDNLLVDMDNSISTKIGAGVIALGGFRSAASDAAVASLVAKGFTVNVKVKNLITDSSVIFRMDFQNNYNVYSNSLIDITSGNGVGSEGNLPTFALSGRKPGEYCAVFNGSQSIKTTINLQINSDKVTVAFWIKKNTQSITGTVIYETGSSGTSNLFAGVLNASGGNFVSRSRNVGVNENQTAIANNTWLHIVTVINRSENGSNEIKTYVNGVLATSTKPNSFDNNGNFLNDILFIGQRAGSTVGFEGSLTRFKIDNYAFTPSDVSNLYNSQL